MAAAHALRLATHGPTLAAAAVATAVATAGVASDATTSRAQPAVVPAHPPLHFPPVSHANFLNQANLPSQVTLPFRQPLGLPFPIEVVRERLPFSPALLEPLSSLPVRSRSVAAGLSHFAAGPHLSASAQPSVDSVRANSSKFASPSNSSSSPFFQNGAATKAVYHTWHLPVPGSGQPTVDRPPKGPGGTPPAVVVILGWLGAKQKHLRRYAEWYNTQGIHAVTFVLPMASVLSVGTGGQAEAHVDSLVADVRRWLQDNGIEDKALLFHTFSNTGWLTYGAVLETLHKNSPKLVEKIKGCVVDSAPVLEADPSVFAAGFSAALLQKRSSAVQPVGDLRVRASQAGAADILGAREGRRPDAGEAFLLKALERFFSVFLQIPKVKSRLSEVTAVLAEKQPQSPQLYIYSTVDKVIPHTRVESFMKLQRASGRKVLSRRFENSPHVDHFRTQPELYTSQLAEFLNQVLPTRKPIPEVAI